MLLKYDYIGDQILVNLPDNEYWELRFKLFNDEGCEDYNLYLIYRDKETEIRETEYWTRGRPALPYHAVGALYEEIVVVISQRLAADPTLKIIDIKAIESELIKQKYEKLWSEKNYITIDSGGNW